MSAHTPGPRFGVRYPSGEILQTTRGGVEIGRHGVPALLSRADAERLAKQVGFGGEVFAFIGVRRDAQAVGR